MEMAKASLPNKRLTNLYNKINDHRIDALWVTYPANVSYICQYNICDSTLLISFDKKFLITDFRYLEEARRNVKSFLISESKEGRIFKLIASLAKKLKISRLGFEAKHLAFGEYKKLKNCLDKKVELFPTYDLIEQLRAVKDNQEISKIEKAVKLTTDAFIFLKSIIKPGQRELDISAEVNRFIRFKGAQSSSFEIIVASGPRSSMPHVKTSSKIIHNNEPVLVDMGVDISGYKSDLTRMFFLGKIHKKVKKAEEVIFAAKQEAINRLKPGVPIKKIDAAARTYIASFGWSKNFGHSLGHGIGLEVHEDPHINHKNNSLLTPGIVFTIEPAVYFPGEFGLRLEDMVLITEEGFKVLNASFDKSM